MGLWATGVFAASPSDVWPPQAVAIMKGLPDASVGAVLSLTLKFLIAHPIIVGLVTAGILAAIMSSLDSQFLCLGTMFTNDIVLHAAGKDLFSDRQIIMMARGFIVGIVLVTFVLSLLLQKAQNVFDLAIWSFSGFAALTPLVFAALYWRRATKAGAYACILAVTGTWIAYFVKSGYGGEYTVLEGIMPVALCFAAGAVAMIVVSLMTRPPSKESVDRFFA